MTEHERREFLKAAGASLAGVVGMGIAGCTPDTTQEDISSPDVTPEEVAEEKINNREELTERLKKLGEEEPPKKVEEIGADCYSVYLPEDWNQP